MSDTKGSGGTRRSLVLLIAAGAFCFNGSLRLSSSAFLVWFQAEAPCLQSCLDASATALRFRVSPPSWMGEGEADTMAALESELR